MEILKGINALVSFLLEIAMLVAISYFGFYGDKPIALQVLIGVVLPIMIIIFWGLFMAPNAERRFSLTVVRIVALTLFLIAALAFYEAGLSGLSVGLAVVAVINAVLAFIWKQ